MPSHHGDVISSYDDLGALLGLDLSGFKVAARYDPKYTWVGQAIRRGLAAENESFGLAFLSDSTGNDAPAGGTGDWPYELGALLAAAFPHWSVRYSIFSDASQSYPAPAAIQTGSAGARYVRFTGAGMASLQLQKADIATPTDLDVAVKVSLDNYTPGTTQSLVARFGGAGNRSWRFYLEVDGKLKFQYTTDGSTLITDSSTVVTGLTNGTTNWLRAQIDVDNGASGRSVKFFTSTDGITWTQLGTTVTTATAVTLFDATSAAPYEIGARTNTTDVVTGNFYEVRLLSGLDTAAPYGSTPVVAPIFPDLWGQSTSISPSPTGAPILHLSIGCVSGQGLSYLADSTRLPKLLPLYGNRSVFLSTSHNDTNLVGKDWAAQWSSWITAVKGYAPHGTPVIVTQNPRYSPAPYLQSHQLRRSELLALAAQLGTPVLDAYQAFLDTGSASSYVQGDGIHPTLTGTPSGAQVWANYAYAGLSPS